MVAPALITIISLTLIAPVAGFILVDDCEAPPQCTCDYSSIQCSNKLLPRIPVFNIVQPHNMLYLHLQHNRLVVIPENSFHRINSNQLYIDLSSNNLHDIHSSAFEGVEENVTILKLDDNHLTTFPAAIGNLSNLEYLDVRRNPIQTFDHNVMESIGSLLQIFYVGSSAMTTWPSEFELLKHLNVFHISGIPLNDLPDHAFKSFAQSLVNLYIEGTNLTSIPLAVCDLQHVVNFYFQNNTNLNYNGIVPPCQSPIASATTVNMDNNQLINFPDVFSLFPNMLTLSLSSNLHLTSMNGLKIPETTPLTGLFLQENNFRDIPFEITKLSELHTLALQSNNIIEIRISDFEHVSHLTRLFLSNNPITRIDSHAFRHMTNLYQLSLDNTALTTLPSAVTDLPKVHIIDFKDNDITCTCDELGWLSNWTRLNSVSVTGNCKRPHYDEPLQAFITLGLARCD